MGVWTHDRAVWTETTDSTFLSLNLHSILLEQ
jgi:hypothetical protein